jgi:YfiH family protein
MSGASAASALEVIAPDWNIPGVRAFMTTRAGGVSRGAYGCCRGGVEMGGLNLGWTSGDDRDDVARNHARLRELLPDSPRWLRQVHGAGVVDARLAVEPVSADAAFTDAPRVVCAVSVADCLPILLADRRARVVAAIHAGWRGLAQGVIQATVAALRERLRDADLLAWIGPGIGPARFEVGGEVLDAMRQRLPHSRQAFTDIGGGKYMADLPELARQALKQGQVAAVSGGDLCTCGDPARFYSFRRDRITGRHAALIWIEKRSAEELV